MARRAVALVSGGLDSTTLAYWLRGEGYAVDLLAVNYAQRHVKELQFARLCADRLGAAFDVVDLSSVGALLAGSSLTDSRIEVPHGHYADASMRATVVANRNAIMLAVAFGVAVSRGAEVVATAVHAGDHPVYPDCRPAFITAFDEMERLAVEGFGHPALRLLAPFVGKDKAEIVRIGAALAVPFAETWSCYEGRERHCGHCGTCVERREAFTLAGVLDPTLYMT